VTAPTLVCSTCHTPLPESASFCWVCGTPTPTSATPQGGMHTRPSLESAEAVVDTRKRLERALGAQFTVGDLVGRGGFAEVFSVRDQRLKRDLAVKVLSPELVVNQAMLTRFRREAEAVAALRHPGIVPIYDIGEAGGIAYIVMPLIQGETLRRRMEREGRFSVDETRRIVAEVADALAVAHAAGLVHRDIKPENVMLEGPRDQVLVMDFGIAKAIDPDATGVTTAGLIVGTPHYMSPEQASGEAVDARSDQYSLAVMGYRMVTGYHPFEAETTRALLYKQVFEAAPPAHERASDVPGSLSRALQRGMAKTPAERYPSIEEFAAVVMESTLESPVPPTGRTRPVRATPAPSAPPAAHRRQAVILTTMVAVAGVVTLILIGSRLMGPRTQTLALPPPAAVPAPSDSAPSAADGPTLAGGPTAAPGKTAPASGRAQPERAAARGANSGAAAPVAATVGARTCSDALRASAWPQALERCRTEADRGSAPAQLALAGLHERGQGTPQDVPAAAALYQQAADAGSVEAAFRLGQLLEEGQGLGRDLPRASQLYLQAARRGHAPAMRATGRMFEIGAGGRKDEGEAVNWYRRAGVAGDAPSQLRLGRMYFDGTGVSRNETEGARWYERAAQAGDAEAAWRLSRCYFDGRGVVRSDSLGMVWLERAAARGWAPASEELTRRRSASPPR
jgi:eukaryotic-like serine/threonine-protein kinase